MNAEEFDAAANQAMDEQATTMIQQLFAMPIVGNAHADSELFRLAHEIMADETQPMADRLAALGVVDRAVGPTGDPIDEAALAEYLAETEGL